MGMAAVAMMVECDGGCGVLVRPENVRCDACLDISRLLAARRMRDARNRNYGVPPSNERIDVGTVDHRRGDPCGLDGIRLTLRERAACLVIYVGALAGLAWCGWLGALVMRLAR